MTTTFDAVPEWDGNGILPPVVGDPLLRVARSPYSVSLAEMVMRFGDTVARREILKGFLNFRTALHAAGLVKGFQWVGGSFVEHTVQRENREPRDMDVVTFFDIPEGQTQETLYSTHQSLFTQEKNKNQYHIDAYFVSLDKDADDFVSLVTYWNSLWSHTRDGQWKGYLQINLSADEDDVVRDMLHNDQ